MPAKTKASAQGKGAAKPAKAAACGAATSCGMHPAELEGLTADLKLKAGTPEGRSRLAVLHAVRQAVVERGGAPSCTAYAGALLSSVGQKQDEETTASVMYLLGHVLQHVGPGLLRGKFIPLADVLMATTKHHPESLAVARHSLQCVHQVVREQEGVAWRTPQMEALADLLVSTATDPRPKVRKVSQGILVQLMTEPTPAGEVVRTSLEGKIVSMSTSTFKACTSTSTTESQQLLGMLRDISAGLSPKALQALSQHVLKLLANEERTMAGQVFSTLDAFLASDCGSAKSIARMVATAIENQPPASAGIETINTYLQFLKSLLEKLHGIDADSCAHRVPDALISLSDYLLSQEKSDDLAIAAANVMCDIIDVCIKESMIQQAYQAVTSPAKRSPSPLEAVAAHAEVLLQPRYKRNWHCSLALVQSLINRLGVRSSPIMDDAVRGLVEMHPTLPTVKGASPRSAEELDMALGAAITKMGPARLLALAPLFADGSAEELHVAHPGNKLWLLPLLKKYVRGAPLAFFARELLPLADKLQAAAIAADERGLPVEAKNLMHVNRQLWALLPSFCHECSDLPEALPLVARRMGTSISDEPELRNVVCTALLNAIRSMRKATDADEGMGDEEVLVSPEVAAQSTATLAGFAKNFLPILFNAASTVGVQERPLILDVISEYSQITEPARLTPLFQNVMRKLLTAAASEGDDSMADESEGETTKILLLDLALALMPALDTSNAEFLYKSAIPFVADKSGGVQKRAYKLLQLMSHAHTILMQSKLGHVQEAMVAALPGLQPGASKWRLRCIAKLVEHLPFDVAYMQLIGAIMGEVILGTKSSARKTREVSFAILVTIAQKVDAGSNGHQLGDLFTMLLAGLAGTTNTMVSATVYSLSRLVYEYADRVGQLAPPLLESVMLLFQHKSREVVTAALGFAKVAVVALSPEVLRLYMKSFISNLLLWSGDTRNRFRLKVKVVLERLMRRTSYEEVLEATPEEHRKLIAAVYKRWKRSKTLKARARRGDGEGDEGMADEGGEADGANARLKGGYEAALYGDEDSEEEGDHMEEGGGDHGMQSGADAGVGRRGIGGERHSGAQGAGKSTAAAPAPATKFGFPATSGPDGKPVILEAAGESGVGRKRRRQEDDAQEVIAARAEQDKEAMEEEAVRQTARIHSDAVALAQDAEKEGQMRGQRSWDQAPPGKKRRRLQAESKVLGGSEYQHKKAGAGGDIKKVGRPDPFAYVPFDKRQINKKKSHQPVKALKKVFNATKNSRNGASQKAGGRKTRKR